MNINPKITVITFSLLLVYACINKKESQPHEEANNTFLSGITTEKAKADNEQQELILSGKVESDPDKEINYVSLISGVIDRVYFSLGDKVNKGQALFDIRSTELTALRSELIALISEIKIAERELDTAGELYESDMISEKEMLEAEAKVHQLQAAESRIKSDMSFYSSNNDGTFSIKSPITGYITRKNVSSGSTVSTDSEPLFTIVDLSNVWVTANVYASDLTFINEGMKAEVTSLSYPDEIFGGEISKISHVFDPEDKALKARIRLTNDDLKLKPEMPVVVKLKSEANNLMVSIPSDALIFDNNRYFVIAKLPTGFEIREVSLHGHNNKTTYISSGLMEGEDIVIKNHLLLYSEIKEAAGS